VGNSRQRLAQIRGREIRRLAEQFVASIRELDWQLNLLEHSVERVEEMIEQQFEELATVAKRHKARRTFRFIRDYAANLGRNLNA